MLHPLLHTHTHPKFNISPGKRWVVRSTTSLFEHFGHSSRAFALKLRSKSCDASTQVLVVVFDVLMLEVPEVLKSFSPRISTGVIILPTQTMTLIREFIEIYHTVYLHWSLQKLGNLMTPVLWTICIGLENLCSFKPIRSEVAGGAIFVEKTRQWAYIELDLQGTPPKSHISHKYLHSLVAIAALWLSSWCKTRVNWDRLANHQSKTIGFFVLKDPGRK